jgi:hypothetical protein
MATYPPPTLTESDFGGSLVPPDVQGRIAALVLTGSVLASRLTPLPTNRQTVTFPTAAPDAAGWYRELEQIGQLDLHDAKYEVAVAKIAGLVPISNEMIDDSAFPISGLVGQLLQDTVSADMDRGLFHGAGAPEPVGLLTVATAAATGGDLRSAAIAAWGEMTAAGAEPTAITVFAEPTMVADEWGRTASGSGAPVHGDAPAAPRGGAAPPLTLGPGITVVPAATLAAGEALAVEVTRTYLIEREPIRTALSRDAIFQYDGVLLRIRGRVAVACPDPARSLRTLTIGTAPAAARTTKTAA